jgi:RNA polymerase sigma factor, sigma-70 family
MMAPSREHQVYTRRTPGGSNSNETREEAVDGEDITIPGISLALDRDQRKRSFEQFVSTESGALLRLAQRVLGDPEEARDLVQDALWKAYRSLERFRGDSSIKSWIWRITINEGIKRLRRRNRWKRVSDWLGLGQRQSMELEEKTTPLPDQQVEHKRQLQAIQQLLAQLPDRQRMVVVLRYFEDLSIEEIGAALGIAPGTVKTHLIRAVRQLRADWPKPEEFDVAV